MGLTAHPANRPKPLTGIWARAVSPRAKVCTQPLTTKASQSLPIAYLPASGSRWSLACSGTDEPFHSNLADETRTISSRTPAPSRASFQVVTGLKPPGVLGMHATPVAIASQSARCVAASNVFGEIGRAHV